MNKKEVGEIRKNFTEDSGFMVTHRILTAYIDCQKEIKYREVRPYVTIPADERAVLKDTLRQVLSPSVGKAFTEYEFPNEAYAEGGCQQLLYKMLSSSLRDEADIDAFLQHLAETIQCAEAFAVIIGYCTYSIRKKDKNDEYAEDADAEYRFLLTALCPANTGDDGFFYDEDANSLLKKENRELLIQRKPSDGLLYPVFSDRNPDIHHIMYYTKSPKKPNISIVESVLGCSFLMSAEDEKAEFQTILRTVAGDELDYMMITTLNERLTEVVEDAKNETEIATLDNKLMKNLFSDVGVSRERLETCDTVYEQTVGTASFTVSNLVESKTVLTTPEITVHVKKTATDKVRTAFVGGRRCLLIDLDDPCVEVNGLPTNLYDEKQSPTGDPPAPEAATATDPAAAPF